MPTAAGPTPAAPPPGPPKGPAAGRGLPLVGAWLVLLCAWLAQAALLGGGFVLDDVPVVAANPALDAGARVLPRLLREPSWPGELEAQPYRPLTLFTLAVERSLWGGPFGPHTAHGMRLTNLLLHGLAAALLFGVLRRALPGRGALVALTALLFAVHPLASGALGPATGRADVLGLTLALGCLAAWQGAGRRPALGPVAALLFLLACLAKEAFVGLPLLLWILDRSGQPGAGGRRGAWLAVVAALATYLVLWPGPGRTPHVPPDLGRGTGLLLAAEGSARAALKAWLPVGLLADRSVEAVAGAGFPLAGPQLLAAVGLGLALLLALALPARGRVTGASRFALLAGAALVAPSALVLPPGALLEDRAAYALLPLLLLPAAALLEALVSRPGRGARAAGLAASAVALLVLTLLGVREARAGRSEESLGAALIEREGGHAPAMLRLARRLTADGVRERAAAAPLAAHDPRRQALLARAGARLEEALAWIGRAVRMPALRADPEAWLTLGLAQLESDDLASAEASLSRARSLEPLLARGGEAGLPAQDARAWERSARLYGALGRVHALRGQQALAANDQEQAVRFEREAARRQGRTPDPDRLYRAALALAADGRYGLALPLIEEVVRAATDDAQRRLAVEFLGRARRDAHERLRDLLAEAGALFEQGSVSGAVKAYEDALRVDPRALEARLMAARLRGQYFGNFVLARRYVAEGLELLAAGPEADTAARDRERLRQLEADLGRWEREDAAEEEREAQPGR